MLQSRPVGPAFNLTGMWNRMFKANTTFFQEYWNIAGGSVAMIGGADTDWEAYQYYEWSVYDETDQASSRYYGILEARDDSKPDEPYSKPVGVARKISSN